MSTSIPPSPGCGTSKAKDDEDVQIETNKKTYGSCEDRISTLPKAKGWFNTGLWLYEGFYYWPFSLPGLMRMLAHFNARSSDVLITSFPKSGFVKLNFNRSFNNSSVTEGFIIWDWIGKLLKAGVAYYGNTSILMAKARALPDGLNLAIQVEFDHLIVEGDHKMVIQGIEGKIYIPCRRSITLLRTSNHGEIKAFKSSPIMRSERQTWQLTGYLNSVIPSLIHFHMIYVFHNLLVRFELRM